MVSPINYMMDIANPMQMAIQGYNVGADQRMAREQAVTQQEQFDQAQANAMSRFGQQQSLAERRFGLEQEKFGFLQQQHAAQQAAIAAEQKKVEAMQADLANLANLEGEGVATSDDYLDVMLRHPSLTESISTAFETMTDDRRETTTRHAAMIYKLISSGNTDMAREELETRLQAAQNAGDQQEVDTVRGALMTLDSNPEGLATMSRIVVESAGEAEILGASKQSEAEAKISRMMEVTNPNTGQKFTREEAIQTIQLHAVAADGTLVNRATGETVAPSEGPPLDIPGIDPGIEDFGDPTRATGLFGIGRNLANVVADSVGLPFASPSANTAKNAMSQLADETMLVLAADFPGRPSNLTRETIQGMTVKPNELWEGTEGAKDKLQNLRKMIADAVIRADTIANSTSGYTAQQRSQAREARERLRPLFLSYDRLIEAFEQDAPNQEVESLIDRWAD